MYCRNAILVSMPSCTAQGSNAETRDAYPILSFFDHTSVIELPSSITCFQRPTPIKLSSDGIFRIILGTSSASKRSRPVTSESTTVRFPVTWKCQIDRHSVSCPYLCGYPDVANHINYWYT